MSKRMKPLYTVPELAEMAGVSYKRMLRLLDAYGIEFMSAGGRCKMVPLSELREKMQPLYDSFKARDTYEEIVASASLIRPS